MCAAPIRYFYTTPFWTKITHRLTTKNCRTRTEYSRPRGFTKNLPLENSILTYHLGNAVSNN